MKTYLIGNKEFTQDKLKLGQLLSIVETLRHVDFKLLKSTSDVILSLKDKLPQIIAIILKPPETEQFFIDNMDADLLVTLIQDFLSFNAVDKLLNLITAVR